MDLIKELDGGIALDKVCLLDPKAERELSPTDGFSCFLFGASKFFFLFSRVNSYF
jgi:ribosome biogenesis SPOUT family RNA methylase Rps3